MNELNRAFSIVLFSFAISGGAQIFLCGELRWSCISLICWLRSHKLCRVSVRYDIVFREGV